jgi:hypothetical protein
MHDESTTFIRQRSTSSRANLPGGRADGLEWQGFATRYFPGRRRHDLDALTAYETYRHGSPLPGRGEGARADGPAHSDDAVLVAAAMAAWEAEGGSVQ